MVPALKTLRQNCEFEAPRHTGRPDLEREIGSTLTASVGLRSIVVDKMLAAQAEQLKFRSPGSI